MDEISSMALCTIADALSGHDKQTAPRILTQKGDPWGTMTVWYVPAIPAAILVEWEAARTGNESKDEASVMTALPAKDEESAWRIAFGWVDDWLLARPDQAPEMDDSPF